MGYRECGNVRLQPRLHNHRLSRTPRTVSSATIFEIFLAYLKADDFPGADMARKFLQMGWSRARRYANHKGGRKYDVKTDEVLPRINDPEKAAAAAVFYERYVEAREHPDYVVKKKRHQQEYEKKAK